MDEVLSSDDMKQLEALLEAEPSSGPAAPGPDIPSLREKLAVLVSSGKAKEAIGVQLTHEQVKRLSDKDIEKYAKRYETYVGSKTTDSLIDSFIFLATKVVGMAVKIKDIDAYQKELKDDYILNNELTANAALITTKHIDFASHKAGQIPQQSPLIVEELQTNGE
jgi:ribosomal protein S17E